MTITIIPLGGIPEVRRGDDVAALIVAAAGAAGAGGAGLEDGDVLVVAQKIVSKAEGATRSLRAVQPTPRAALLAESLGADPHRVQVTLDESVRIVRDERVLIVETKHGFVCANAGVDHSNVPGDEVVTLLPSDSDASAHRIRDRIGDTTGCDVGVIISDTFGRPWRNGITNVALGVAGLPALIDYRGQADDHGEPLTATVVATADEIAGAAELVMGKTNRVPAVIVRGTNLSGSHGSGRDLIRTADEDLFR